MLPSAPEHNLASLTERLLRMISECSFTTATRTTFSSDLLAVCANAVNYFKTLFQRCGYFKLVLEGLYDTECPMLGLLLYKGGRFSRHSTLDYRLYVKPTSVWKPLSPLSSHASCVHSSWPQSQCVRIRRRFSCKKSVCMWPLQ